MKHGKCPTRRQKELLQARRLDPANWLVIKDTPQAFEVLHRHSLKPRLIYKPRGLTPSLMIYDELTEYAIRRLRHGRITDRTCAVYKVKE